jgi:hypothetical protein
MYFFGAGLLGIPEIRYHSGWSDVAVIKKYIGKIKKIEERFSTYHIEGSGKDAVTQQVSTGWWAVLDGPVPVSFRMGDEDPKLEPGSGVEITLKVGDAFHVR